MINDKLIKVCGMREADNIRDVEQLKVDMIGFIFYPKSPAAYASFRLTCRMRQSVWVSLSTKTKEIEILADRFSLDYIQLHGNESPEYCHSLRSTGLRLIKAFSIARRKDFENTEAYENLVTISCSTPNVNNMAARAISSTGRC